MDKRLHVYDLHLSGLKPPLRSVCSRRTFWLLPSSRSRDAIASSVAKQAVSQVREQCDRNAKPS
ncbi:MAG: hypothetical protein HC790_13340 [Acaryochloridaceae cyanobacterium CSU_3_4]|nr:hypothetical protein [Acaryochloridaceae cyanobacterium CSU_3_4]